MRSKVVETLWHVCNGALLAGLFLFVGYELSKALGVDRGETLGMAAAIMASLALSYSAPKSLRDYGILIALVVAVGTLVTGTSVYLQLQWGTYAYVFGAALASAIGFVLVRTACIRFGIDLKHPAVKADEKD